MSEIEIEFIYDGEPVIIQCGKDVKMKDIFKSFKIKANAEGKQLIYLYGGRNIENEDLTFNDIANQVDKNRNKMNILVIEGEGQLSHHDNIIKSKKIICPECKEDIKFSIDDYVINLFECKNKHDIDNIFLDKFESTQNINISKIICEKCGNYNKGNVHDNIFYRCNNCKINLCPICYSNHDKNHNIINYDDKNYIYEKHDSMCMAYCNDCKQNICMYCEKNHDNHNIINYGKLIPNKNDILKKLEEKKINLDNDINEIIIKLNKVKENYENYYNIIKNLYNNFNKEKINYEILYNMNNINNNDIMKDIDNIINDNNIENKFNKIMNIYNKMNIFMLYLIII